MVRFTLLTMTASAAKSMTGEKFKMACILSDKKDLRSAAFLRFKNKNPGSEFVAGI